MLRITIHDNPELLTFQLEGKLAGPWVQELKECWQHTAAREPKPVLCFDLTGVTYIDAAGKEFLAAKHTEGAVFVAAGCLMKAIVAEVTCAPMPRRECPGKESDGPFMEF